MQQLKERHQTFIECLYWWKTLLEVLTWERYTSAATQNLRHPSPPFSVSRGWKV